MTIHDVVRNAQRDGWFLTEEAVAVIAADERTRLVPIVVRCGGCRFTTPAQDVAHLVGMLTRCGGTPIPGVSDYVRDLSVAREAIAGLREVLGTVQP